MRMEKLQSTTIVCRGGLDSNENWLDINQTNTGIASELINFEPSLYGGYRRINGFTVLEDTDSGEVDPTGAEGKIYGVFIYNNRILAARKQQAGATYEFYEFVSGSAWSKFSTGLTFTSISVNRVRYTTFNFDGTEQVMFVDGINKATLFDGTNWIDIDPAATGADFANAGGPQALSGPKFITTFKNHIFVASGNIVAYSAPRAEYDWTAANGAGQLNVGTEVMQIMPFRDELYVFGDRKIKKISVDSSGAFVVNDVTNNIGCIASDSVIEISGDLLFLAEDGIRPIAATTRINDIELASVSKRIQQDIKNYINTYDMSDVVAVVIPSKTQFRYFFTPSSVSSRNAPGVIGGIKDYNGDLAWEWGLLKGIKVSCVTQGRFGAPLEEYVIHGTHDGKVMRQEVGSSFNGVNIQAVYSTPYIDFETPMVRKSPQEILIFLKPEGPVTADMSLTYDWNIPNYINPANYENTASSSGSYYGSSTYGVSTYGSSVEPIVLTNIEGSGRSMKFSFVTDDTSNSYSIQGMVIKYLLEGYK